MPTGHRHSGRSTRADRRGTARAAGETGTAERAASPDRAAAAGTAHATAHDGPTGIRAVVPYAITVGVAVPWFAALLLTDVHHLEPVVVSVLSGAAIVGAAFLMSWSAEILQLDVSQALALAVLALIAVLPEYAVDAVFAWKASSDPTFAPYAIANMTGSNRLLVGFGWASVVLVAWWRTGRKVVRRGGRAAPVDEDGTVVNGNIHLPTSLSLELAVLAIASVYALAIPYKGRVDLFDAAILVGLFAAYAWATAQMPAEPHELEGPAAVVGAMPAARRRTIMAGLLAYATAVILLSAEHFAEGLVLTGKSLGIDEFLLVQWLAPLASESPEFLVALLFAWRGMAGAGLRTLVSSLVNQWTLLVGTLGVVYRIGQEFSATPVAGPGLPLDFRQTEELLLTSVFSLFALSMIANFDLSVREAALLGGVFIFQLVGAQVAPDRTMFQFVVIGGLVAATAYLFASSRDRRAGLMSVPGRIRSLLATGAAPPH